MRYGELVERLRAAEIENASGEARLLLEHFCGGAELEREYDSEELTAAVEKRCGRYPLQYILGKWWFARCELEVNEHCLVPRPDTELLVELAQKRLPENAVFADLCTGSGCIAIATLDLRPDTAADAYELYPETLSLAARNAAKNKVAERFTPILGDVLEKALLGDKRYDAILSNPPYIQSGVIDTLEKEVLQEPRTALDGGEDGLLFYRAILKNFAENLKDGGFFLFEIGYDQGEDLKKLALEQGFSCEIKKDLGGCDRAALLYRL